MKVVVTTLARNEERIIPYFIHHYAQIADVICLYDHESTDDTVKIATAVAEKVNVGLQVITIPNKGFDDELSRQVKENAYKPYRAADTIVMTVDADELFHHPDGTRKVLECLHKEHGSSLAIKPKGYQLVSLQFPDYYGCPITEVVTEGVRDEGFDKAACFSSELSLSMGYGMHNSAHYLNGETVPQLAETGMMLLHCKFLGAAHRVERNRASAANLSPFGKRLLDAGIGIQFRATDEQLEGEYQGVWDRRKPLKL